MSLESKIETLTVTVELLIAQMKTMSSGMSIAHSEITTEKTSEVEVKVEGEEASVDDKAMAEKINAEAKKKALAKAKRDAKKAEVEEKVEAVEEKVEEKVEAVEVTADDVKAACLTEARAEEGNKVKVKALLAKYDATVVKDVAPANRAEILAILESGEF